MDAGVKIEKFIAVNRTVPVLATPDMQLHPMLCMMLYTTDCIFGRIPAGVRTHARRLTGRPNVQPTASTRTAHRLVLTSGDASPDTGIPVLYSTDDYAPGNTADDVATVALEALFCCVPRVLSKNVASSPRSRRGRGLNHSCNELHSSRR